jgi:hypothetical protein
MSETVNKSAQFWVRSMSAQARRAAKAIDMANEMACWRAIRDRRGAGTVNWTYCDTVARACGARASAYIALRDGDAKRARILLAKSRGYRPVLEHIA